MKKLTPLISVEDVDRCLPFWTERLGFEITATVPHGDGTGFAMLHRGGVDLMYQSRASLADDIPVLAEELVGQTTTLFIEVDGIDALLPAMEDVEVLVPRRQTFYGMDELWVRADCGTAVGFAARIAED